jgi:predicted phage tail protein
MKKFILHGEMADKFCDEIELDVETIREAFNGINANFSGFKTFITEKSLKGLNYNFVNSENTIYENFCGDVKLSGSTFNILPVPEGRAAGLMPFLGNMAMGFGMQWLMEKLNPVEDDGTPEYEIIETNSFIYTSNENLAEQGTPVPIVYGQIRVGSKLIHSSVENYDYDYDEALIYEAPTDSNGKGVAKKIAGGKYSFVQPASVIDYRSSTEEAFKGFKDSTSDSSKRSVSYGGPNGSKSFNASQGNESFNENYQSQASKGGERKVYGPSEGGPRVPKSSSTTVPSSTSARPYLFPPAGTLDANMRPQTSADLCVERASKAGMTDGSSLAYISKSQPMTVGGRGSYQKLESIGIYKSLEILSEGPIAGFANPIEGFEQDSGYINFPLGSSDAPVAGNKAKLSTLKYSEPIDHVENKSDGSANLKVIAGGSNYTAADGSYDIVCDGRVDATTKISIRPKKPLSLTSATIGDCIFDSETSTTFQNNIDTGKQKFVSENKLFLLNESDGSILPNKNTKITIDGFLDAKYKTSETIGGSARTVFLVDQLQSDAQLLGSEFSVGRGYGSTTITHSIDPNSERIEFDALASELNFSERSIRASALDHGKLLKDDLFNPEIQGLMNIIENSTSNNIPNTTTSWSKMCRIQIDSSNDTIFANRNNFTTITIGKDRWFSGLFTRTANINITVRISDLLGLATISRSAYRRRGTVTLSYRSPYNDASTGAAKDRFQDLMDGKSVDLGVLMKTNASFAAVVWNSLSGSFGGHAGTTTNSGQKFFKFVPGSGNPQNASTKIRGTHGQYTVRGGYNDLDSVEISEPGFNPSDKESASPRGFYHPFLFPRVTVFVLRKSALGFGGDVMFSLMPTNIDAVASVSEMGTVKGVHLINCPDKPVFDSNVSKYTDIFPQDISAQRPTSFGSDPQSSSYNYQDIGFYLKIDKSSNYQNLKFDVNQNGTISNNFETNSSKRRSLIAVEPRWTEHIRLNGPTESANYAEGMVPDVVDSITNPKLASKGLAIDETQEQVSKPSTTAAIRVGLECLNLSGARTGTIDGQSRIMTGRPISVSLTNAGAGYFKKDGSSGLGLQAGRTLFNSTYGIKSLAQKSTQNVANNKGYKPNQKFYVYGISKDVLLGGIGLTTDKYHFMNFKALIETDSNGTISNMSVLDPGTNFSAFGSTDNLRLHDPDNSLYPTTDSGNNILKAVSVRATALGTVRADNESSFFEPDNHFPKAPLVIESISSHLSGGSVNKFYIKENGSGFNIDQGILNPYGNVTFTGPTLTVTFSGGKITAAKIKRAASIAGYSSLDKNITLSVSPGITATAPIANNPNNDGFAWARSIYLNDVPVRDNNNRFNYSKFHFDLRIGHHKNGNKDSHIDKNRLTKITQRHIISDEFKIPAYTKFVDYPLYGPRNENEKDYYYAYTIKNPEITDIALSIKINELHYIYEGDEAAIYLNLIPMLLAAMGYMIGVSAAKAIAARIFGPPDPVAATGTGIGFVGPCGGPVRTAVFVGGAVVAQPSGIPEIALAIAEKALILGGGILGILLGLMIAKAMPCKWIPFLCFKVGEVIKNSGEIWPSKMRFMIEYGLEGEDLKQDAITFRGCATNEYVKDIYIHNLPAAEPTGATSDVKKNRILKVYRLTRELDPVTGGITEARYKISSDLLSITEYIGGFFSYPNTAIVGTRVNSKDHPNVPKKEYLLKGRLIKIPSNYFPEQPFNPVKKSDFATKSDIEDSRYAPSAWDGTFKTEIQWTSNPAWIIYDLLINERYGMGKYGIKESDIDKWSFYEFAKRCDEEVDVVIESKTTTERRHMCNLYIDAERQAYDYIKELMAVYNANLNFTAGKIYITLDAPVGASGAIMLFTNANISEDGFSYSSTPETARITAATVDYLDERDNYMQKSEYVEDAEGVKEHGYSHKKIAGIGITRRGEAHRLGWHKILTRQLEKEIIQFKTGLQASYLRIGDVFEVLDNNKVAKHAGGRVAKVVGARTLELDIPSSALSNVSHLYVQKFASSDEIDETTSSTDTDDRRSAQFEEYQISSRSGFNVTFISDIDTSIKQGSTWIIKENSVDKVKPKRYRVKDIKEISNLNYEIIATEYLDQKYENIDNTTGSKDGIDFTEREYDEHVIIV